MNILTARVLRARDTSTDLRCLEKNLKVGRWRTMTHLGPVPLEPPWEQSCCWTTNNGAWEVVKDVIFNLFEGFIVDAMGWLTWKRVEPQT